MDPYYAAVPIPHANPDIYFHNQAIIKTDSSLINYICHDHELVSISRSLRPSDAIKSQTV